MSANSWIAVHLFYNEPWEEFLIRAVKPYVDTVMKTGIANQYFFIRYWDRGPHIRLRFRGEHRILEDILKPNLSEYFLNYFESKPSHRTDPNYPPNFPEEFKWFPNNTIQHLPYDPETARFGGLDGLNIAHRHFQASSQMVLNSLKKDFSYDEALGLAIKMHLSLVHSLGFSIQQVIQLFALIFENWLPHALRVYQNHLKDQRQLRLYTIEDFRKAFELQRKALIPFHQALWAGLEKEGDFEDEQLNNWVSDNLKIRDDLRALQEQGKLMPRPPKYKLKGLEALPPDLSLLYEICSDYIHLSNNRLGISNKDEGYLAYLIRESMKTITPVSNRQLRIP